MRARGGWPEPWRASRARACAPWRRSDRSKRLMMILRRPHSGRRVVALVPPGPSRQAAAAPAQQNTKLTDAVDHASGVYFPNRAHQVHSTKRLRCLVELASTTTRPRDDRELTALKRVQSVLGDLRTCELLLKRLDEEVHRARKSTRFVSE